MHREIVGRVRLIKYMNKWTTWRRGSNTDISSHARCRVNLSTSHNISQSLISHIYWYSTSHISLTSYRTLNLISPVNPISFISKIMKCRKISPSYSTPPLTMYNPKIEHSISIKAREKYEDWARQPSLLAGAIFYFKTNSQHLLRDPTGTWDKMYQHWPGELVLALLSLLQLILK